MARGKHSVQPDVPNILGGFVTAWTLPLPCAPLHHMLPPRFNIPWGRQPYSFVKVPLVRCHSPPACHYHIIPLRVCQAPAGHPSQRHHCHVITSIMCNCKSFAITPGKRMAHQGLASPSGPYGLCDQLIQFDSHSLCCSERKAVVIIPRVWVIHHIFLGKRRFVSVVGVCLRHEITVLTKQPFRFTRCPSHN